MVAKCVTSVHLSGLLSKFFGQWVRGISTLVLIQRSGLHVSFDTKPFSGFDNVYTTRQTVEKRNIKKNVFVRHLTRSKT